MAKIQKIISTQRKKKPKEMAIITDQCTGCAGAPACIPLCPVEDCMLLVDGEVHGCRHTAEPRLSTGDRIGFTLDMDVGTLVTYFNGVPHNTVTGFPPSRGYHAAVSVFSGVMA